MRVKRTELADEAREERQVRKQLPFTVTPIANNDIKKWKADQAAKEAEYQARKAAQYAVAREALAGVLQSGGFKALAGERYESPAAKYYNQVDDVPVKTKTVEPVQEKPKSKSIVEKTLDLFLNTNFTPKE